MANELYKNIIQRLPAALVLVTFIFAILYLQNVFIILALLMVIGILLINEWLRLSDSKIDLKQIIFFVTLIMLSVYFADEFIDLFLALTAIFWITYSFYLISNQTLSFISFHNNYLGTFLILGFLLNIRPIYWTEGPRSKSVMRHKASRLCHVYPAHVSSLYWRQLFL